MRPASHFELETPLLSCILDTMLQKDQHKSNGFTKAVYKMMVKLTPTSILGFCKKKRMTIFMASVRNISSQPFHYFLLNV